MDDDFTCWWQALNSEAERWEAEHEQLIAKKSQIGLPTTPSTNPQQESPQ